LSTVSPVMHAALLAGIAWPGSRYCAPCAGVVSNRMSHTFCRHSASFSVGWVTALTSVEPAPKPCTRTRLLTMTVSS
jgi:hypothetical protein